MKKKRGMSQVVATIILVLLAIVAAGMVGVIVRNIIGEQTKKVDTCFGNIEKLSINDQFTCYDSSADEFHFSIDVGDITVEKIIVSISNQAGSKSLELLSTGSSNVNLRTFSGSYGANISAPLANSGITYVAKAIELGIEDTKSIRIALFADGQQCGISDSLLEIVDCGLIA